MDFLIVKGVISKQPVLLRWFPKVNYAQIRPFSWQLYSHSIVYKMPLQAPWIWFSNSLCPSGDLNIWWLWVLFRCDSSGVVVLGELRLSVPAAPGRQSAPALGEGSAEHQLAHLELNHRYQECTHFVILPAAMPVACGVAKNDFLNKILKPALPQDLSEVNGRVYSISDQKMKGKQGRESTE